VFLIGLLKIRKIFYGFWGKCFNDYREHSPHKGYKILYDLAREYFSNQSQIELMLQITRNEERKKELQSLDPKNRYFIYTSNVDSHFIDIGFGKERVDEIHGSCSQWFCPKGCPDEKHPDIWDLPVSFRFNIDLDTMRLSNGQKPKCPHCNGDARPHVLMFDDWEWIGQRRTGYTKWKKEVLESNRKVVILEVGCGKRVPTVRNESENYIKELGKKDLVTLIRINPDFPECKYGHTISIRSGALDAISKIYRCILTKEIWHNPSKNPTTYQQQNIIIQNKRERGTLSL